MKKVAGSTSESEFETSLQELSDNPAWQRNCNVHQWFERKWLPEKQVRPLKYNILLCVKC